MNASAQLSPGSKAIFDRKKRMRELLGVETVQTTVNQMIVDSIPSGEARLGKSKSRNTISITHA
jgi:hypothetical protein